ncbi:GNAT family protein [Temperatibacter marinus]|uniref:GNAT family protein n=2 Tax=Temperatibacter marinus TaxID=1456591 RepID=A0AA52EH66_9PROT|nr:GNAT family protein [Temperatibacter marinus]WND02457.1 GNAT family protein [Temperatibacter marinus]
MNETWLTDVTLNTGMIYLRPLEWGDREALIEAASDGELWKLWFTSVPSAETIDAYIDKALRDKEKGEALAFVVGLQETGQIIGCSRFCHADSLNKRVEIGYTWYSKSYQRTAVNSQCKLLLLSHAFEQLGAIAVEFKTHHSNERSQTAIMRLGAKHDGILRQHQKLADGSYRDTYVYSILNREWPDVKARLALKTDLAS